MRGAEVSNRTSFTPSRQSSFGAANLHARAVPPSSVQNRSVMARTAPAAAASHIPVRTMNTSALSAGRPNNNLANRTGQTPNRPLPQNGSATTGRQNQLSQSRPPSAPASGAANNRVTTKGAGNGRTWEAQGNSTDRGRAPQGFGSSNRPANTTPNPNGGPAQSTRMTRSDRPPWAGSGTNGAPGANRGYSVSGAMSPTNGGRPSSSMGNRSYEPPSRSYSAPSRSYSPPRSSYPSTRSYSPPPSSPSRSYSGPSSAPSRSYSPPSHSSPAPRSSGGGSGGAAPHGGGGSRGGGSPHGGGSRH